MHACVGSACACMHAACGEECTRAHATRARARSDDIHDELAILVQAGDRRLLAKLYYDGALVVTNGDFVCIRGCGERPHAVHVVVQRVSQAVRAAVPDAHRGVFAARHDERQARVEEGGAHVVGVPLHGCHTAARLVIPHAQREVVRTAQQVRLVAARVVVDAVYTALMPLQAEVGRG